MSATLPGRNRSASTSGDRLLDGRRWASIARGNKPPMEPDAAGTGRAATSSLPTFNNVQVAARAIAGVAHRTPIATSRTINARLGPRTQAFFKCEQLQRAGAFKFRGAYYALSRLSPDERRRGVVAF